MQNKRPIHELDKAAGIEVTYDFERFEQRNDIFTRAFWDSRVRSKHTEAFFRSHRTAASPRRGDGFTQRDFALRNAAWTLSDIISSRSEAHGKREGFQALIEDGTPVDPARREITDPVKMSEEIRQVAKFFGAGLCGITDFDERWIYASRVDTRDFSQEDHDLPEGMTSVIVLGHPMDKELVATYPSALGGAATGKEYSKEAMIVIQVAAYIRALGYEARASMNDTGLAIPFAIKAGLGEYARNQMVITPEYGPRLRFSKIFTNLPLAHDTPRQLGVKAYCDVCDKCAKACPVNALPFGAPEVGGENVSAIKGVKKWTSNAEKCFSFWAKTSTDCAICMRVCPFNRDFSRLGNRIWRWLALSRFRAWARWLDQDTPRLKPTNWWDKGLHRKARKPTSRS